jgi:hypothetical protein
MQHGAAWASSPPVTSCASRAPSCLHVVFWRALAALPIPQLGMVVLPTSRLALLVLLTPPTTLLECYRLLMVQRMELEADLLLRLVRGGDGEDAR